MGETSDARYRAGNGEPLLLLHGFTGTWRLWHPVLAELVARFDVLAPTLPGHYGGPPAHLENPFSLGDLADWVEDELDAHGMPTAHIVGNSMGGALALELAKRGRARSVLAISPGFSWLPGNPEGPRIAKHFRKQHASTHKNEPRLDRVMRWSLIRHHALGAAMYHGERMSPHDAVAMARASLGCTVTDQVLAAIESGSSALECLDEVAVPTLIAWPEHDRTTPRAQHSARFENEIPDVTFRVLPAVGHIPMYDDPPLISATIAGWIDGITAPPQPAAARQDIA